MTCSTLRWTSQCASTREVDSSKCKLHAHFSCKVLVMSSASQSPVISPQVEQDSLSVLCRDSVERIEVLSLPLKESKAFTEDSSYPKSAGLLFGLMWLRAFIAARRDLPADHVV